MKKYIVFNANGKDIIGGMASDGHGVSYDQLPPKAREAIDNGTHEYENETEVTSQFITTTMTYYIRKTK